MHDLLQSLRVAPQPIWHIVVNLHFKLDICLESLHGPFSCNHSTNIHCPVIQSQLCFIQLRMVQNIVGQFQQLFDGVLNMLHRLSQTALVLGHVSQHIAISQYGIHG